MLTYWRNIPQVKWKYEKIKDLGRGAFGTVFLAHNITISKLMAVKRVELSKVIQKKRKKKNVAKLDTSPQL